MSTSDILLLAAWKPCPVTLPDRVRLGQGVEIIDVPLFLATQISRLASPCAQVAGLAAEALEQFITITNLSTP